MLQAPADMLEQDADYQVAVGAILADVTVLVRNLALAQNWCAKQGLHLLSVQPLSDYGYTLYFYAFCKILGRRKL